MEIDWDRHDITNVERLGRIEVIVRRETGKKM